MWHHSIGSRNIPSIREHDPLRVYHFTDPRNIPSIREHGLLSWDQLLKRNIPHIPASNELSRYLDRRKKLQNFVRLTLGRSHPMVGQAIFEGRIQRPVWLEIDNAVFSLPTTRYSNKNAAANDVLITSNRYTAFASRDNQAEVLVEGSIPCKWIKFPNNL